MSHERFEQHIRDTLRGHPSPMDKAAFWEALERKRKRKRRLFFFWLPLGLLTIGAVLLIQWYQPPLDPVVIDTAGVVTPSPGEAESISDITGFAETRVQDGVLTEKTSTRDEPKISVVSEGERPQETERLVQANSVIGHSSDPKMSATTIASSQEKAADMEMLIGTPFTFPEAPETEYVPFTPVVPLDRIMFLLEFDNSIPEDILPDPENPVAGNVLPASNPLRFSFGLSGGAGQPLMALTTPEPDEGTLAFLEARQNTERPLEVLQAGADLLIEHQSGLGLRTGLEYRQFATRFDYSEDSERFYSDSSAVVRILEYPDGSREEIIGAVNVMELTNRKVRHYNYFRFLEIPVAVRYRFSIGTSLNLFVEGGASFNIWKQFNGKILDAESLEPQMLETMDVYTSGGLQPELFGSIGVQYGLRDRFTLFASPQYRHRLGPVTNANYLLEQRLSSVSILFGVRMELH